MIQLHYAKIDLDGDIPVFEINTIMELRIEFLFSEGIFHTNHKVVYLASINENIFVSHNFEIIYDCISKYLPSGISLGVSTILNSEGIDYIENTNATLFVQEYPSYQEAYKVALDMMECNELCYSSATKDSPYWNNATPEFINSL